MRKVWVGIFVGTFVVASMVWAAGGQHRYGQTGTQPRNRQGVCSGYGGQGSGQGARQFGGRQATGARGRQNSTGTCTRDRKRDGSCQRSSSLLTTPQTGNDSRLARKQIRDRKHDGSCQLIAQTRTRTHDRRRDGTC